jgi:endonuclease/exonuclease/phosphatase family metal-dependent hydrolase
VICSEDLLRAGRAQSVGWRNSSRSAGSGLVALTAVRIVSLNAWGGTLFDQLVGWLPGCGADVLCLQEVTRTAGGTGWMEYRDAERTLPQRADLFDDVRSLLPRHQAMFVANDAGPVVDERGAVFRQDFGLAMFVRDTLPVIGGEASFVHGTFTDQPAGWAASGRSRIAQGVRLLDRDADHVVTVVHLHGLRDAAGKHDTSERLQQAHRVAALVDRVRGDGDLVVVCGDLNLLPASETFAVLAELGLQDLVGEADTRTSRYTKPLRHASYLLVSDPGAVRSFEIVADPEVSDHRALVVDLFEAPSAPTSSPRGSTS